jgi:uncharacterized repeat protein (TIGR03803 family)
MNLSLQSTFYARSLFECLVKVSVLLLVAGRFAVASAQAQIVQAVESSIYRFSNTLTNPTGAAPQGRLIIGSDGALYGVNAAQGSFGSSTVGGTIFKVNRDGSGLQVLHTFGSIPYDGNGATEDLRDDSALLLGSDNALYGTTGLGGTNGDGIIFRVTQDGSDYRILHSFDNSNNDEFPVAGLIQGSNGALYGTTGHPVYENSPGVVFSINPDGSDYTVLTNIGFSAAALLQGQDGALYGTSGSNNTIFRANLDGSGLTILHTFNVSDGNHPLGQLIQSANGYLLGTTTFGGTSNFGTLFMVNTNGNGFQVLHNFGDGQVPQDGQSPYAGLALGPGNLFYGTTGFGGGGHGTVFKINQDGSGYEQLFMFPGGGGPVASLVAGQPQGGVGALYGTDIGGDEIYAIFVNPPLSVSPVTGQSASNQLTVTWPSWAFNYVLQSTTNISSTNWVTVTNGIPVTGVQLPNPGNGNTFYRLAAPN